MRISDWSSDVCSSDLEGLPWDVAETLPEDARLFPGTGYAGALEVNTPARWLALRPKLEAENFQVEYAPSFQDRKSRRVGKECASTGRSRWSPHHKKNKNIRR